jgi:hypothetical protein
MFAVADYGIPEDRETFWHLAQCLAAGLHSGERVLIHGGAGIGRTGTLAICVLLALGMTVDHDRLWATPKTMTSRCGARELSVGNWVPMSFVMRLSFGSHPPAE